MMSHVARLPDIGIKPYYADPLRHIYFGDCLEVVAKLSGVSAVVTDPPFELNFMGKSWDAQGVSFQKETWETIRRACLPGAPFVCFGGTRTYHRIAVAIEDAGWEIRDCIMHIFGQGFPKSLDIAKSLDKSEGIKREVVATTVSGGFKRAMVVNKEQGFRLGDCYPDGNKFTSKKAVSLIANIWSGYGTALKPAYVPIILAMNPVDKTFVNNALVHGVAGLNIDGCRVEYLSEQDRSQATPQGACTSKESLAIGAQPDAGRDLERVGFQRPEQKGRWPSDFIHDGSEEVLELFPQSKGQQGDVRGTERSHTGDENTNCYGEYGRVLFNKRQDSNGSAARFFYCAKASRSERNRGCEDMSGELGHNRFDTCTTCGGYILQNPDRPSACKCASPVRQHNVVRGNTHPTVKPMALMEYLCKLVKMPEYNLVLDPFVGSGTTLLACGSLGILSVGIDSDESSCEIAARRCGADMVARIQRGEF